MPLAHTTSSSSIIIRSRIWEPSLHRFYPESFRESSKEIMLCSSASQVQPCRSRLSQRQGRQQQVNAASLLPRALWMEILSYVHRDWFEQPQSEEDLLRRRVQQLESSLQQAQEARQDLEKRLRMAEGERTIYRRMARTWQSRIERVLGETLASDILDGALVVMNHLHDDDEDDDDSHGSDNDNGDDEHILEEEATDDMEEEDTVTEAEDSGGPMDVSHPTAAEIAARRQVRVVSISSEDI
jgi:hypothetical protein